MPVATIGTSRSSVVGNSPSRVSITFRNDSTNDIYLAKEGTGVTTSVYDYHLKAGDAVNFNLIEDGDMVTTGWEAIASGSASKLSYVDGNQIG